VDKINTTWPFNASLYSSLFSQNILPYKSYRVSIHLRLILPPFSSRFLRLERLLRLLFLRFEDTLAVPGDTFGTGVKLFRAEETVKEEAVTLVPFPLHSKRQAGAPRLILRTLMSAFSLTLDGEPFGVAIVTVHGVVTNSLIAGTHLTGGVVSAARCIALLL